MFEDSLIESGNRLKTARGWTSTIAFAFQIFLVVVLVLIPLIFTEALPKQQLMTFLVAPPPPPRFLRRSRTSRKTKRLRRKWERAFRAVSRAASRVVRWAASSAAS